jgi:hypothetical protein
MLKYAEIKGYNLYGEVSHHIYQWMEKVTEVAPKVIIINAYEGPAKLFKGFLFLKTLQYESVPVIEGELENAIKLIGEVEIIEDFNVFNEGTSLESLGTFSKKGSD